MKNAFNYFLLALLGLLSSSLQAMEISKEEKLFRAAQMGNLETIKRFATLGADLNYKTNNCTPLSIAAQMGRLQAVKLLIGRGADVNQRYGLLNQTALHAAFMGYSTYKSLARKNRQIAIIKELKERGADINALDNNGLTPLDYQAEALDMQYLDELTELGFKSSTLLPKLPVVQPQLESGAQDSETNSDPNKALLGAALCGEIEEIQMALTNGAHVNYQSSAKEDGTALYCATLHNHPAAVKELIKANANINIRYSVYNSTVLHIAFGRYTGKDEESEKNNIEIIKELRHNGADINALDGHGETPLDRSYSRLSATHKDELEKLGFKTSQQLQQEATDKLLMATTYGSLDQMKEYLEAGADINTKGNQSHPHSLLYIAASNNHESALKLLLEYGAYEERNQALDKIIMAGAHNEVNPQTAYTMATLLIDAGGYVADTETFERLKNNVHPQANPPSASIVQQIDITPYVSAPKALEHSAAKSQFSPKWIKPGFVLAAVGGGIGLYYYLKNYYSPKKQTNAAQPA